MDRKVPAPDSIIRYIGYQPELQGRHRVTRVCDCRICAESFPRIDAVRLSDGSRRVQHFAYSGVFELVDGELIEPAPTSLAREVTITHNHADGTLLDGLTYAETRKGTPVRQVLDTQCWRWKRGHDAWGQLGSADRPARRSRINATAEALRELGYTVTVEINDMPRDPAEVERDRQQRDAWRAQRRAEMAAKHAATAEAIDAATDRTRKALANTPILIGHNSEGRHRRLLDRLNRQDEKAFDARRKSVYHAQRAKSAEHATGARNSKVTTGNRIARLESEIRRLRRERASADEIAAKENELAFWREQWAAKVAAGEWEEFGPDTVRVGGAVLVLGVWRRVVRVSKKSVSLATDYSWTDRVPWHEVQRYVPPRES